MAGFSVGDLGRAKSRPYGKESQNEFDGIPDDIFILSLAN
jgi:hypothetical protein